MISPPSVTTKRRAAVASAAMVPGMLGNNQSGTPWRSRISTPQAFRMATAAPASDGSARRISTTARRRRNC